MAMALNVIGAKPMETKPPRLAFFIYYDGGYNPEMNDCEALNSTEVLTPCSTKGEVEESETNCDSFEGEEPTEEQVANAMRHSSTSSSEASPMEENEAGVSEEPIEEKAVDESSNDTQVDDTCLCPKCGSNEDPQFIHYKKILQKPANSNYGAFVWRYRCARRKCAEFFGDHYVYDRVSNSFVQVPEDSVVLDDLKVEFKSEHVSNETMVIGAAVESLAGTVEQPHREPSFGSKHVELTDDSISAEPIDESILAVPSDASEPVNPVHERISFVPPDEPEPIDGTISADPLDEDISAEPIDESISAAPSDGSKPAEAVDESISAGPIEESASADPIDASISVAPSVENGPTEASNNSNLAEAPDGSKPAEALDEANPTEPPDKTKPADDNILGTPTTPSPHKSSRRQKQTSRKRTGAKAKAATGNKKSENKAKDGAPRPSSKQRQNNVSDPTKFDLTTAPKKLRKGYVYEVVPIEPPRNPLDINSLISNGYCSNTIECGTQTMGGTHFFSILIDQLVNSQAELTAGLSTDEPFTVPSYISRRLMVSQQLMKRQSDELSRVQEENKRLHALINLMNSVIRKFGDEYTSELRHLRDTIGVLKREFSFYQEEFVAEAKKSIDNITAQKEEIQKKIDDVERKNRLLLTRIDLHIKEKEAVEERADGYLREISARDRDVILANKSRDRAERKLNDTLYVANNAKCAHCQISDKMRSHLTDVVAEKTVLLEKCRKECANLQRRADHSDRISRILSKDSEKLKFELNNWKSDAERNLSEISRLKEELKKASSKRGHLKSRDKVENLTPKQPVFVSSPALSGSDGKSCTPTDSAGSHTQEEQVGTSPVSAAKVTSNAAVQVALIMPTPPEEPDSPFSSWLPKDRKKDSPPTVPSFNATSVPPKLQASLPVPTKKSLPFNGSVIIERPVGKQVSVSSSPMPDKGIMMKSATNSDRKTVEGNAMCNTNVPCSSDVAERNQRTLLHGRDDATPSSSKANEKIIRMPPNKSSSVEAFNVRSDSQPLTSNTSVPSKIKPAVEQLEMVPRKESRKRKSSMVEYLEKIDASRSTTAPVLPFNGPVSLSSGVVSPNRAAQPKPSEAERTRFSSSPLPWHRHESSSGYRPWEPSFD
nr:hypothetical protein LOC100334539 [Haemonchus contortus]